MTSEITKAAEAVNKKGAELDRARVKLRSAEADARLLRSAQSGIEQVPVHLNDPDGHADHKRWR